MDIHGIRTLNLVGTIIFAAYSLIVPIIGVFIFGFLVFLAPFNELSLICFAILLLWIVLIGFFTFKLYDNTVSGLDRGEYETAKRWIVYGAVMGFIFGGGWITLILFLISYISFDEAVWPRYYYPSPYYYPYPPANPYGPSYQQPAQNYPCTNCGQPSRYMPEYQRWYCDTCKKYL